MPLTHRSTTAGQKSGAGANQTITMTLPGGTAAGDLLVAMCFGDLDSRPADFDPGLPDPHPDKITGPSGWTDHGYVRTHFVRQPQVYGRTNAFSKVATAGDLGVGHDFFFPNPYTSSSMTQTVVLIVFEGTSYGLADKSLHRALSVVPPTTTYVPAMPTTSRTSTLIIGEYHWGRNAAAPLSVANGWTLRDSSAQGNGACVVTLENVSWPTTAPEFVLGGAGFGYRNTAIALQFATTPPPVGFVAGWGLDRIAW